MLAIELGSVLFMAGASPREAPVTMIVLGAIVCRLVWLGYYVARCRCVIIIWVGHAVWGSMDGVSETEAEPGPRLQLRCCRDLIFGLTGQRRSMKATQTEG